MDKRENYPPRPKPAMGGPKRGRPNAETKKEEIVSIKAKISGSNKDGLDNSANFKIMEAPARPEKAKLNRKGPNKGAGPYKKNTPSLRRDGRDGNVAYPRGSQDKDHQEKRETPPDGEGPDRGAAPGTSDTAKDNRKGPKKDAGPSS